MKRKKRTERKGWNRKEGKGERKEKEKKTEKERKSEKTKKKRRTFSFNPHPTPAILLFSIPFIAKCLCVINVFTSSPHSNQVFISSSPMKLPVKVKTLKGSHITQPTGRPRHKSSHTSWNTFFTWLPGDTLRFSSTPLAAPSQSPLLVTPQVPDF